MGLSPANKLHLERVLTILREFEASADAKELVVDVHSKFLASKILK